MNDDQTSLEMRLLKLLHHAREEHDETARAELNALLRENAEAQRLMPRLLVDEQVLVSQLRDESIVALIAPLASSKKPLPRSDAGRWYTWRPLTAAAAGIVFGMFCTSMVFGYVAQRAAVKSTPLPVFDPSFEEMKPLDKGLPHNAKQWGVQSARIVSAESGAGPLQGQRMLRMEPVLMKENDANLSAKAFQVLDLRSLPLDALSGAREAQVTASFCAPESDIKARYLIRVVALNESPAAATENFWAKAEDAGVVSLTQRFETEAGDSDWHTFSVKTPLPPGAQSLVIILSATSPKDETVPAPVRYLDDVQVSLLTSPSTRTAVP